MLCSILATSSWLLAQLEDIPESPSPLTEGAGRIFEVGAEASANVAATFDNLWIQVLEGALYQAMAQVGVLAAIATLGFFLVQLTKQLLSGEGDWAFGRLIWPLIAVGLLANGGENLAIATQGMRSIGNQVNNTVLNSTVESVSLQEEYQQSRLGSAVDDIEAASISECRELQREQGRSPGNCIAEARLAANSLRQQYGLAPAEDSGWFRSALQWLLRNFLFAIHSAFQWATEIVLLIVALLGPLAVGLSLTPSESKPLFSWVSGFFSIFLIKLTLNLISGIAAYAISQQEGLAGTLLLPALLGLLAPILSVMVGLQGGTGFFNALSTASVYMGYRGTAGFARKGAGRALGGIRKLGRRLRR